MIKSQLLKHWLLSFLPLTALLAIIVFVLYSREISTRKTILLNQQQIGLKKQQELLGSRTQSLISDVMILASHQELDPAITSLDPTKIKELAKEFLSFSRYKKVYDQVRFIDKSGNELIRINCDSSGPFICNNLQFKGNRYYFKETMELNKGEVFFSHFDLNMENGKIEQPFKPMIRIGTPVFSKENGRLGIVLLNYYGRELISDIEHMVDSSTGTFMLVNSDGFWIKGFRPEDEWGFQIKERRDKNMSRLFPQAWETIQANQTGQFEDSHGLFSYTTIYPLLGIEEQSPEIPFGDQLKLSSPQKNRFWKLISFVSQQEIINANAHLRKTYLSVTFTLALFIALASGLVAFFRSKREQADSELLEAQANINNIFNSSIPLCVTDKEHNIVMSNDLYNELFGCPESENTMIKCHDSRPSPKCHTENCPIDQIFKQGKEHYICESTVIRPNNERMYFIIASKPFRNSKGELIGILESFQDVTSLKMLETEYAKVRNLESLGVVAGGIAHDFNNLLTAISGYVMLAKTFVEPDSKAAELLTESEKASLRAKKLTQRIITFSRGGSPIKKPTYIANFLVDAVKISISGDQYTCIYDIPTDLPMVAIDEGQILQVITNIVTNAKEAMPDGGTLKVAAKTYHHTKNKAEFPISLPPGDFIQISIEDHGIGIPEDELLKIFDPYYSSKKLGAQKGIGLGLSTAYSIISKHGGSLHVTSTVNKGTTVYIHLPIEGQPSKSHREGDAFDESKLKILVMDDEALIRDISREIMDHMKWSGEFAKDGSQAIDMYTKAMGAGSPFNLVILDLSVPGGMGGYETLKLLKEIDPQVKAIASSGFANDPIINAYEEYGFCAALPKPYTPQQLSDLIHDTLEM